MPGKPEIEQDDFGPEPLDSSSARARRAPRDFLPEDRQQEASESTRVLVVVDDENAPAGGAAAPARTAASPGGLVDGGRSTGKRTTNSLPVPGPSLRA